MDELATAAAAVAIATDAYAEKDSELGLTFTTYMDVAAQEAAEERINVDKENDISIPAEREVEAGNPKVLNATREPRSTPHAQPIPQVVGTMMCSGIPCLADCHDCAAPEGRWHVPRGPGSSESHG